MRTGDIVKVISRTSDYYNKIGHVIWEKSEPCYNLVLVWIKGKKRHFTNFDLQEMGLINEKDNDKPTNGEQKQ